MRARRLLPFLIALGATLGSSAFAITLDATKINTAGVYAAGSAVPTLLRTANAIGKLASKWPVVIGMSIADAVIRDMAGQEVHWLPSGVQPTATHYPVPAGWSSPNNPPAGVGTQVVYRVTLYGTSTLYENTSLQAVAEAQCKAMGDSANGAPQHQMSLVSYSAQGIICAGYLYGSYSASWSAGGYSSATSCAAGYQLVSGSCVLNEGTTYGYAQWPADGKGTLVNGGQWSGGGASGHWKDHVREPDADKVSPPTGTFKRSGLDEYGNPTKEDLEPLPDGGVKYRRFTQGEDSVGAPVTVKHEVVTNNAGDVTNNTYQYFANQTIETVYNEEGTPTAAQPVDLQLPDDYARENTLQGTNEKLEQIKEQLEQDDTAFPALSEAPEFSETLQAFYSRLTTEGLGGALSNLQADVPAGECPVASFEAWGQSFDFDAHCLIWPQVAPLLATVMLVVWAWIGLSILFSA